jgi:hypothetical protein
VAYTCICSETAAEKLQKGLPNTTVVTKLTDKLSIINNQPMIDNIRSHIHKKKYKIRLIVAPLLLDNEQRTTR